MFVKETRERSIKLLGMTVRLCLILPYSLGGSEIQRQAAAIVIDYPAIQVCVCVCVYIHILVLYKY